MLRSQLTDQAEYNDVRQAVARFSQPADTTRIMARVAALLTPYYTGDVPQGVRMIEAEDWAEALAEYPEWAITKACRWWKGADNPHRRKKPLEGDIEARAKTEMGIIKVAEMAMRHFESGTQPYSPVADEVKRRVSKERAAEILAEAGFTPKRMGQL